MEHEVFVPVPVPSLRRTLGDPARVARCVPGLQRDADSSAGPLSGRLRIRVDGHTITYRGALRLTDAPGPEGSPGAGILVTGEGVEARGSGSVKLSLTVGLTERDGGTAIGFAGTASGDGRFLELDAAAALAAARRLLDRFAQQLVTETLSAAGEPDGPLGEAVEQAIEEAAEEADTTGAATARGINPEADGTDGTDGADGTDGTDGTDVPPTREAAADEAPSAGQPGEPEAPGNPPGTGSVFDAPVPPPSLDPVSEAEFTAPGNPPAEAAHARRTMIGRSAEEVDHAPPRGRYAPVPSPDSTTAGATLRWVAPAAALALASAVVVTRALRRRR
ncbi:MULTISPECIES: carbon monoxide dehydrogenase [unclassified Streptomyces]|uniref:carbon monoxide dehydrogenase n=1 Tax=unclassified Streptomyces TaxID=2593676 RepID=UPI003255F5BE